MVELVMIMVIQWWVNGGFMMVNMNQGLGMS